MCKHVNVSLRLMSRHLDHRHENEVLGTTIVFHLSSPVRSLCLSFDSNVTPLFYTSLSMHIHHCYIEILSLPVFFFLSLFLSIENIHCVRYHLRSNGSTDNGSDVVQCVIDGYKSVLFKQTKMNGISHERSLSISLSLTKLSLFVT